MFQKGIKKTRFWSNVELRKIAPHVTGDVVNVSAWDDRDKEGRYYKDYFTNATSYSYTNYPGDKGLQKMEHEYELDLTEPLAENLKNSFDAVFNHTTLEHIYECRVAFKHICEMSRDLVILVVPFVQKQHEGENWKDYWRFTPSTLRSMFEENNIEVIYESSTPYIYTPTYLFFVGSKQPEKWKNIFPNYQRQSDVASWVGESWLRVMLGKLR